MGGPAPAPAPAPPPESAEMVQEILLKLPTRDVARCCCVSRLWRSVVANPTFRTLHAEANHVSAAPPEALLVTKTLEPGRPDEACFFRVSSPKPTPLPHRVTIPSGYRLSNVCNGLLCFAPVHGTAEAPAFICNPVTGETTTLAKAPPPDGTMYQYHHFALAFSPSTKEHKLFRFSLYNQSVCTLDGAAGDGRWRQRSYRSSECPLLRTVPPVLVQGKLYLVTTGCTGPGRSRNLDGLIEVDVAAEERRTHRLPFKDDEYHSAWDPLVNACEMEGRLCLAVDILWGVQTTVRKIQFWVLMSSPPPPDRDDGEARWELRYSFHADGDYTFNVPRSVWFDDAERTLCYNDHEVLYKHGTRGRSPEPSPDADCPQCDRRIQLPPTPSNCQWNIFGGYHPSLLSPLTLAPPPSSWDGEEERQKFEHALLLTL